MVVSRFLLTALGETDENCIRNDDIKTDMDLPASRELNLDSKDILWNYFIEGATSHKVNVF